MHYEIRDFRKADGDAVNRVALAAYAEFSDAYSDWPALVESLMKTSAMADAGELVVAEAGNRIVGLVVYVGPGRPKSEFFRVEWPVIRMLSVDPATRGHGIGRALVEECIRRARRDGAPLIALHTSAIMTAALPMYLRMGFRFEREAPPLLGVAYGVYTKTLADGNPDRQAYDNT